MATNRIETLDPALIRPGRIDRKIEFPLPDVKTKRRIFGIHTSRMTLAADVDLEEFVMSKDDLSGADIKAICTEAGLFALRERRMRVVADDLRKAKEKVLYRKNEVRFGHLCAKWDGPDTFSLSHRELPRASTCKKFKSVSIFLEDKFAKNLSSTRRVGFRHNREEHKRVRPKTVDSSLVLGLFRHDAFEDVGAVT
jgi:SpoVK/Ycf46/Vps4 family AAA+-type ATPase